MTDVVPADPNTLVARAQAGDAGATDLLFGTLYRQLHHMALQHCA